MIEAVNSVLANAPLLRGNADQSQQNRLTDLATAKVDNIEVDPVDLPLAPFVSPFIEVNNTYKKAVLQIRDSNTGDVVNQFPSETTMRARAARAEIETQQAIENLKPANQRQEVSSSIDAPDVQVDPAVQSRVAEAQIASAALSTGSVSGQPSNGGVSVFA